MPEPLSPKIGNPSRGRDSGGTSGTYPKKEKNQLFFEVTAADAAACCSVFWLPQLGHFTGGLSQLGDVKSILKLLVAVATEEHVMGHGAPDSETLFCATF
jgi:hypothetical protein